MKTAPFVVTLSLLCPLPPAQGERAPIPTPEQLNAARDATLTTLADLMVERAGDAGDELIEAMLEAASARSNPASRYLLLQQTLGAARKAARMPTVLRVVDTMTAGYAVDGFELRMATLDALAGRASVPDIALVSEYLKLADQHAEATDPGRMRAALQAANAAAQRTADALLIAAVKRRSEELATVRIAWQAVAASAKGSVARGEYLCFYRDLWTQGRLLLTEPAALAAIVEAKGARNPDGITCVRIAEFWLDRVKSQEQSLPRRNLRRHALQWYRRAWPQLEGLEQQRVTAHMDRLEDQLASEPAPGHLRFDTPAALQQCVIQEGEWRVEKGQLYGRNTGPSTRATYRYAFSAIDTVTIRGGIQSAAGLNFRLAVGDLNILFNWEVRPENHFYIGAQGSVTTPHALKQGVEHCLRIRQIGMNAVVFLDGVAVFSTAYQLAGTVAVYPALQSEIFVREISINGAIDPLVVVRGPVGTVR